MKRTMFRCCVATSVLGSALLAGCSHSNRAPSYRPISSVPSFTQNDVVVEQPVMTAEVKDPMPESLPAVAQAPKAEEKTIAPASYTVTGGDKDKVPRRSFADITADPCYGHADNYAWLSGELQYSHGRGTWRLRYASVDEEDKYGGSVTLTEMGPVKYSNGDKIKVEGEFKDVDSREPSPAYRVRSIAPVK